MRRVIIMIFAVIATMLSFNQKANAQKQVKVPVFEGIITAKKGTVNIRKEASAQSEDWNIESQHHFLSSA